MSINKCIFTGRTTADVELKQTPQGKEVASFSLAVDVGFGESKRAIFVRCVAWQGQAKYAAKVSKGTQVAIVAEMDIREYTDKQGAKKQAYEFTVRDIQAFSAPKDSPQGTGTVSEGKYTTTTQTPAYESLNASDDLPF